MRAGIGLVALLLGVGLMVYLFSEFSIPVAREGKNAQEEARQIAGYGEDGRSALESVSLSPQHKNGKLVGLQVASVVPGGPMDSYYGLRAGDVITGIGSQAGMEKVSQLIGGDDMAEPKLLEAYQRKMQITVARNGREMTLPATPGASPAPAPAAQPSASSTPPPAPAPAPPPRKPGGLERQLDAIQGAGGAEQPADQ
jgi:hypothetical protein